MNPKTIKYLDLKELTAMHGGEIADAAARVVASGWYLYGEETEAFEREYARFIGTRHAVGCGNGLDALTLILKGYLELGRLSPGDGIIVPAHTFIATVLAVTRCGLRPVFADPELPGARVGESGILRLIECGAKGFIAVHLYGRNSLSRGIMDICREHGVVLIEDNAQAHGAFGPGGRTGSLGHAAAHSFYPGKNLGALGDGGAVTTDDDSLAGVVRELGNYGSSRKYMFARQGVNSRLDEIQAAVLRVKLRYLDSDNRRRGELAALYRANIDHPSVELLPEAPAGEDVNHIFPVFSGNRDSLREWLRAGGIETLIHYPLPPHRQEAYRKFSQLRLPNADRISATELSLPISPTLENGDILRIARRINGWRTEKH